MVEQADTAETGRASGGRLQDRHIHVSDVTNALLAQRLWEGISHLGTSQARAQEGAQKGLLVVPQSLGSGVRAVDITHKPAIE